ncbi:rod shape-determining protein MreD [Geothermobacter ehrlichii]|uniref:Rod shape-determining protein MreD n=1 Tax=Geothermobacter ehrlichii TaxID=213224 RepID=A0A5D3WK04_9BACT|nr:rod shape-determining protein MreD [Geothermobacter ehrlichii]TYO98678.1 rod shape-determining protein MreD [Geothermobacter ehrlichii]
MTRVAGLLLLAGVFALVETALWPGVTGWQVKPDLLLVLTVYVGLTENAVTGGLLVLFIGSCLDALAGAQLGLNAAILLSVYYLVLLISRHFNAENELLLYFLVACGTLVQGGLLVFLGPFADVAGLWLEVLPTFVPQLVLNLLATWGMLRLVPRLRLRLAPGRGLPGLKRLEKRYGP